ncbi:hypothetical protein [Cohnella yongneupensis]|uniref:Uncharacterized protein n=1 Tax=Cohnella yongneupensis TaxID=425006 RepID=A0ABW0QV06_9BACL
MTSEEKKAFNELMARVEKTEKQIEEATQLVPAPAWFVKEFGSADLGGLIHEPKFTAEGWRLLAIGLRSRK